MQQWFALPVNPDPWAVGSLGMGRKNGNLYPYMGRNQQLHAYKEAVKELLDIGLPADKLYWKNMPLSVKFYFWRRLDGDATRTKNTADVTNLQKATEDALQGVLIDNDRNVREIRSVLVDQGPDVVGKVALCVSHWSGFDISELPDAILGQLKYFESEAQTVVPEANVWPPRG